MSEPGPRSSIGLSVQIVGAIVLVLAAAYTGWWLGAYRPARPAPSQRPLESPPDAAPIPEAIEPPLFFFVKTWPRAESATVIEEVRMAAEAGIHQYVIGVLLPWPGEDLEPHAMLEPLQLVSQADPQARIYVYVRLDPPDAWLAAHSHVAVSVDDRRQTRVCVASHAWREEAKAALNRLIATLKNAPVHRHVTGYVLGCLEQGQWYRTGGYDGCEDNVAGFRAWLQEKYEDDMALQTAWGDTQITLAEVGIPPAMKPEQPAGAFFSLPQEQRHVDFRQYTSECTAEAITLLCDHIKSLAGKDTRVIVPYGYTFELAQWDTGHGVLGRLLKSNVDGMASPISYHDRGVGGAGGFMGPVDSAAYHDKQWYIIDDTRTGISRNPANGAVSRLPSVRPDDVYNLQKRNFAAALAHGLGLFWEDVDAAGNFHDEDMWARFKLMREAYKTLWSETQAIRRAPARQANVESPPLEKLTLLVVVDEISRFYQQDETPLTRLFVEARDAVLRTGTPAHFCLLQDVLDGKAESAAVYLFLNAFHLSAVDRARLHERFAKESAVEDAPSEGLTAIWMYAPGYIEAAASAENISATTLMRVKELPAPARSGSLFGIEGTWMTEGQTFGEDIEWRPLFYIDQEENVLARYRHSKSPSVALRFTDEGWTSVYIAEPTLTPDLLCELLGILEQPVYLRHDPDRTRDVCYFGPSLIAIHGKEAGERTLDLGWSYAVQDLLEPQVGWPQKYVLDFSLKSGETRVLHFVPNATASLPATGPANLTSETDDLPP